MKGHTMFRRIVVALAVVVSALTFAPVAEAASAYAPLPSHAVKHLPGGKICYPVTRGVQAARAANALYRTGDYRADMAGYLGQEDSSLVDAILSKRERDLRPLKHGMGAILPSDLVPVCA